MARVERASLLLRRQRARAAGKSLGDVRVSIPSRMHSQCTGFASSLTSQSSRLESNQHPSCSQGTCPATRLLLGRWVAAVARRARPVFSRLQSLDLLTTLRDAPGLRSPRRTEDPGDCSAARSVVPARLAAVGFFRDFRIAMNFQRARPAGTRIRAARRSVRDFRVERDRLVRARLRVQDSNLRF